MRVGIVGGGIMGVTLGYFLARQGAMVDLYETSPMLGGLAGPLSLEDGTTVDRFYHAILSSDSHLRELVGELDLADQMRFRQTKMGFYFEGCIHSMNNMVEFLRFPPLGWIDRLRLGLTVLEAQRIHDWHSLESTSVEDWLLRWSGPNTYRNIWRPMLKAKFDGGFDDIPATWIWSRLVRMKSTRSGTSQKEEAGHLVGGYSTLLQAMADAIAAAGGAVHLKTSVQEIVVERDQVRGLRVDDQIVRYDAVVSTIQTPLLSRLLPGAPQDYRDFLAGQDYLGVLCPLLVLDRPLTGYWTLNITDDSIPFTGVIETTAYIDPSYVGGRHLVYLPKYTAPGSHWQERSDEEVKAIWLDHVQRMFPAFDRRSVRFFVVNRSRFVEPLHGLNSFGRVPAIRTPVDHLYLATTAQVYPALTNGESVTRHARNTAQVVLQARLDKSEAIA